VQMVQLAARTRALEQENANLQFMLGLRDSEITRLRSELASPARGAGAGSDDAGAVATSPTEPAALTGSGSRASSRPPTPVGPPAVLLRGADDAGGTSSAGPAHVSPHDLVDGLPAPPAVKGAASGVVRGVDGQWLRIKLNPGQ
jgi:hypothetical protein